LTLNNIDSLRYFVPEGIVALTILLLLVADMLTRARRPGFNASIAVVGLLAAFAAGLQQVNAEPAFLFMGMITLDPFGVFFKLFFFAVTAVIVVVAHPYRELTRQYHGESYAMMLRAVLGMSLLATSSNLLMIYLALEMTSLPSYLLTSVLRHDAKSSEAGLKYVLFGAAASGAMVYGMSLFYGMTGSLALVELRDVLMGSGMPSVAMLVATAFVLAGFGFKISMVPFHNWTPDVYEGASTPVTAFFSVAPKAAGIAVLLRFFFSGLASAPEGVLEPFYGLDWPFLLAVLSAVTMTLGNLAALKQDNVKRMLAYSSIAHAGYMLMGAVLLNDSGVQAILFYLVVYGFMNLGAFLVVIAMSSQTRREEFESYRGLGWRMPLLAVPMAIFMFSLTGIPPFAGFVGKVYLFKAVIEQDLYWLALIGLLNSVVSLYYYMRIVKTMYLDDPGPAPAEPIRVPWVHTLLIVALAVPTLVFGVRFGLLDRLSSFSQQIFWGS
jgi:NADH-quinone oxidoreductase subunit N